MSSEILSRRQMQFAQTSFPETIWKEVTCIPVGPGWIFHTDSQYLPDIADQAKSRRESVQQTFGGPTRYGHRAAHSFQPSHFPFQNLEGMTEDKLGVTHPVIEAPDSFTKLPKLTSFSLQPGEDLLSGIPPGILNPGEAMDSSLRVAGECSHLCLNYWQKVRSDPWVLHTTKTGYSSDNTFLLFQGFV